MNPKFMVKASYLLVAAFGAFHLTKLFVGVFTGLLLARFGKPQLVRETSKIYTNNIFMVPWMYTKKFIH
jgi:hypothetical protein